MLSSQLRYFLYGAIISTSLISLSVSASQADGVFGDYFTRIIGNCTANSVVTGFDPTPSSYGTRQCSTLQSLIGSIFGSLSAPYGQVMIGFNLDGSPKYGNMNWQNSGGNISYTGGNVGIGTNTPSYKLDINGEVINNGWYRSRGTTGWYNETYGGGVYMTDTSFVRTYGNKAIAASSFYDQDNMGFYLNPDSISRTNRIDFSHAYDIDDGNYYLDPSWASRFNYLGRNYGFNWTEYDWNDTSYYVDPNNTSSFNSVRAHTFLYHSDRRLKKNIVPVSHSLDKITSLTGYTFDWIRDGTPDIGIIAQEVERVFPDIVHTDTKTGMKSVKYGNLVAPIIEAIKEIATNQNKQDKKIQELQDEINELRKIIKK